MRRFFTAGVAVAAWVLSIGAAPLAAQEISETAVQTLVEYAWALTPERFTKPNGEVVIVDRKAMDKVMIPLDQARAVIRIGRLSAHTQNCDMKDEHAIAYRVFMQREDEKKKWTEQQMLFMNQLHLVTVMLLTGKLKVVANEEGKAPEVLEDGNKTDPSTKTSCTDEQKGKIVDAIKATLGTLPTAPPTKSAAGGAAPAATTASEKK
jgi:hypothetical protein